MKLIRLIYFYISESRWGENISKSNSHFYKDILGFNEFSEVCDPKNYFEVPEDWYVVVADVEGSTVAIEKGRYKDVNMSGVACIAAVINVTKGFEIPYVFGGDGATFLIPPILFDKIKTELSAVKQSVSKYYELSLRVGFVPVKEIKAKGKLVNVAKYITSTGCALSMFSGGGVSLADNFVKSGNFLLEDSIVKLEPDLSGLSCRWQPIQAKGDTIMTLLVSVIDQKTGDEYYKEINDFISKCMDNATNPISGSRFFYKWPSVEVLRQCKIVWAGGNKIKNLCNHIFLISLFNICNRFGVNLGSLDIQEYKKDMISNSDYRKFDDMLRMVIDCTNDQAEKIKSYLEKLYSEGQIFYGIHRSNEALMTCFLTSLESNGHVHFIDGNNGGYALAAQQLKKKKLSESM